MTIAELRGKLSPETTRQEDLLTSDVFGALKNVDRQAGLGGFLKLAGIELAADELATAEFSFWERMADRTEPDVIVRTASALLLIEAKYLSALGADRTQLRRELDGGKKLARPGQSLHLIAVTVDPACPDALDAFRQTLEPEEATRVHWTSWQQIAELMESICSDPEVDIVSRRYIEDLCRLFDRKNLRGFRGFTMLIDADQNAQLLSRQKAFAAKVANLIAGLRGILQDQNVVPLRSGRNMIERDGRSMSLEAAGDWVTTYYAYPMVDVNWTQQGLADASLVLKVFLDTAELGILGAIQLDRRSPQDLHRMVDNDAAGWCEGFREERFRELPFSEDAPVERDDVLVEWGEGRLAVYRKYPLCDFQDRPSIQILANQVIRFRDMMLQLAEWVTIHQDRFVEDDEG